MEIFFYSRFTDFQNSEIQSLVRPKFANGNQVFFCFVSTLYHLFVILSLYSPKWTALCFCLITTFTCLMPFLHVAKQPDENKVFNPSFKHFKM